MAWEDPIFHYSSHENVRRDYDVQPGCVPCPWTGGWARVYPLCSAHYKLNVSRPQLEQSARLSSTRKQSPASLSLPAGSCMQTENLLLWNLLQHSQSYNFTTYNTLFRLTAFSSISSKSLYVLLDLLLSWIHEEDCKCLEWTRWMEKYVKLGSYFIVYSGGDVETRFWQSFILRWDDQPNKSDAYFYHWWLADLRNLLHSSAQRTGQRGSVVEKCWHC